MLAEAIKGDVIHKTSCTFMTFYRLEKKLPNLGIALSKRVIECCDTGNDCATKIKTTTSLMKLSLTLRKVPTCKQL